MKSLVFIITTLITLSSAIDALTDGPYWCTQSQRSTKLCKSLSDPVFAAYFNGTFARFDNECFACKDSNVKHFYDITDCPKAKAATKCAPIGVPVCGINSIWKMMDFTNQCEVCNYGMSSYFRGECPKPQDPNKIFCPPLPRPTPKCTKIYRPVCATLIDGTKEERSNDCMGCNGNAVYYEEGGCTGKIIIDDPPVSRPITLLAPNVFSVKPAHFPSIRGALKKNLNQDEQ